MRGLSREKLSRKAAGAREAATRAGSDRHRVRGSANRPTGVHSRPRAAIPSNQGGIREWNAAAKSFFAARNGYCARTAQRAHHPSCERPLESHRGAHRQVLIDRGLLHPLALRGQNQDFQIKVRPMRYAITCEVSPDCYSLKARPVQGRQYRRKWVGSKSAPTG